MHVETVEHPRRPVRLVDGDLVTHPDSRTADCVVWAPVPDAVEGGPQAEGLPAVRLDGDRARIASIPFFPYHVSIGDEVQVREQDGTLYFVAVVTATSDLTVRIFDERSGVSTEQALVDPDSDEPFWGIARALAPHGCWFERYSSSYASMSVAPAEWEYVRPFLELRARATGLQWELATPLRVAAQP